MSDWTTPMVSVRLMTYNHARFIRQAMDGIFLQQVPFAIEVVVGDDFSTDTTLEIIRSYANTDRIQIVILERKVGDEYWTKRQTLGRLYNFTDILAKCQGKYIALLDGDDYWTDPNKLQKQVDFLENNPTFAGVFHDTMVLGEEGEYFSRVYGEKAPLICGTADTFSTAALCHSSSFVFRTTAYTIPDWYYEIVSADMALFSIVSAYGPIKRIAEVMSVYRKHSSGLTSRSDVVRTFHQKRIELINHLNAFHRHEYDALAKQVINEHMKAINKLDSNAGLLIKLLRRLNIGKRVRRLFDTTNV